MLKRRIAIVCAGAGLLFTAPAAQAEVTSVFDGAVACETRQDGSRFCGGPDTLAETFDGQLIDVNVALPPAPSSGPDGPYPLVMHFHGYGGTELDAEELSRWTDQGYAAFSMSDRGFGPCGAKPNPPARCLDGGWVRLMDTRFEVRDAQLFAGMLVDEGVAQKAGIAAAGGSYGGGLSMALAALKNRTMLEDGSLVRWKSPEGRRLSLTAAIPEIPWTDLANSLMPNGRTLDYVADAPYLGPDGEAPVGVMKQTFVTGLYASGAIAGLYAPPLADPDADLHSWFARINAGEPYADAATEDILDEVMTHHSSYYIDHSIRPAPLLISNGWTDDIFPPDEAIRFYNRTRTQYRNADISLFFLDYGHQRGQNKDADIEILQRRQDAFLAHHLTGAKEPRGGVTTLTQTCGSEAPSDGPFHARSWARIARGEVRGRFKAAQTIAPSVPSDGPRGQAYDPIGGGGACATAPGSD
ncbi:MAG: acetylxylan esterase, partial [Actinomycetota bacterium]|nr:acetylxylan esterase [Actinomycetota bacterium]